MTPNDNAAASAELTALRKELRARMVAARLALAPQVRQAADAAIQRHLDCLLQILAPTTLGFCWPYQGEFDARPLARACLERGAAVYLPVPARLGAPLTFQQWTPDTPMADGPYGIPVPLGTQVGQPTVLLIPLNGFDIAGFRLGYGGGYFDRTLAALRPRPLAIGVGFEINRLPTIHPQSFDERLDYVVSEAGVFQIRDGEMRPLANQGA